MSIYKKLYGKKVAEVELRAGCPLEDILEDFEQHGATLKEQAETLSASRSIVELWRRKMKFPPRKHGRPKRIKDVVHLREQYKKGMKTYG